MWEVWDIKETLFCYKLFEAIPQRNERIVIWILLTLLSQQKYDYELGLNYKHNTGISRHYIWEQVDPSQPYNISDCIISNFPSPAVNTFDYP